MISLDVFDCSITRLVFKPIDMFDLIEQKVGKDFAKKRLHAEELARKGGNYTFDKIYTFLPEFDKIVEINMELDNCIPNQDILEMYKTNPKNFIFISDMYFSSDMINKMLIKCGYENPVVFVSCEYGCGKRGGYLFEKVENIVGTIEKHYGDNYKSDILGARQAGIKAELVPSVEYFPSKINVKDSRLKKFLVSNDYYTKDLNTRVARYFAPLVFAFTKYVLDSRKEGQNIFFNARDGYLPYIIARDIFKAKDIYYIHTSRKSLLNIALDFNKDLTDKVNELFFERLIFVRMNTPEEFCRTYNYTKDDLIMEGTIKDFLLVNQEKLYTFFKSLKKNALKYLHKFPIRENDLFVDIGYHGSLQFALERILGKRLTGVYLQCVNKFKLNLERYSYFDRHVVVYKLLIECLFSSDEDGINGYDIKGNPTYYMDSILKKQFSQQVEKDILEVSKFLYDNKICPTKEDMQSLVTQFMFYPTLEESNYSNESIFENGDIENFESVVWYDRDKIKAGELQECYDKSYWRVAWLTQLRNDKELSYLEKYLNLREN